MIPEICMLSLSFKVYNVVEKEKNFSIEKAIRIWKAMVWVTLLLFIQKRLDGFQQDFNELNKF